MHDFIWQHLAPKEPLDFKEALPLVDVWRSATVMSGEQCVMTFGALLMPMWSADSWDSGKIQVNLFPPQISQLFVLVMVGCSTLSATLKIYNSLCPLGKKLWQSDYMYLAN